MRLTLDEVKIARQRLNEWQCPDDVRVLTEQLMDKLANKDLFNQAGVTFILEARAAAKFADKRGAKSIRLIPADRPDCELMFAGGAVEPSRLSRQIFSGVSVVLNIMRRPMVRLAIGLLKNGQRPSRRVKCCKLPPRRKPSERGSWL